MIIIEGADATGKTTLAKNLSQILQYDYVKSDPRLPYQERFAQECSNLNKNIVQDRTAVISDFVYESVIYDKKPAVVDLLFFSEQISKTGSILIYCRPTRPNFEKYHKPENYEDDKYLDILAQKYKLLYEFYDYTMTFFQPLIFDFKKPDAFHNILEKL